MSQKGKFTNQLVEILENEMSYKFFENKIDLKASAWLGLYFRLTSRSQEQELKTRALIKSTRVWFKEFSKTNMLNIFHESNRIQFIISEKRNAKSASYSKIRENIESLLREDNWESSPEERSLAFMIGYDAYTKIFEDEEEQKEEELE